MSKNRPLQSMAIVIGPCWTIFCSQNRRGGYWQHLVSRERRYVPHSLSYSRCFASCFWRSHFQPQSCYGLATSELRFDTVGLLYVGCRQRYELRQQAKDNWRFKEQFRTVIGEIQLHTIDNVLKNWTDRVYTLEQRWEILRHCFIVSRSHAHFPALFKRIHNHVRSTEG